MVVPDEDQDVVETDDPEPMPASCSEIVAGLTALEAELAELTRHVRQLSAGLAQELEAQPPPLSDGQLSGVFLAEDGLADELRRHCATWRRLAGQAVAARGRPRAHLRQRLQRRQAAVRAGLACLVRALSAAVALLLELAAFRVYSRADVTHLEKVLALLAAVRHTQGELLAAAAAARPGPAAVPGLRLFRLTFSRAAAGRPPSVEQLCARLAQVRAARLAGTLQARLGQQLELDSLLRQQWPARRAAAPAGDDESASGAALRLPPIPTILIERSSPTSGYASSGGEGDAAGAERAERAPPADLARLLTHEENAAHSLLLAVPAGGRRLLDPHLRAAGPEGRLTGSGRRRLVALYRDELWRTACELLQQRLLWRADAAAGRPALAAAGAPAALLWLAETLDRLSEELTELGLPPESLSARLRLPLVPAYAGWLLTPALHLSQSTLHAPVPLEGGQQCTKCGKLFFDSVSFLVGELNSPCPPLDSVSDPPPELQEAIQERIESGRQLDAVVLQLQGCRAANLSSVSDACRRTALQSLAGLVPGKAYWRRPAIITSQPSDYVRPFIGEVLEEVLSVVSRLGTPLQLTVGALVVKVACYAWMEHIVQKNIKFSSAGARQLARDVAALRAWLRHHPHLCSEARQHALDVDALRELEGVTQLLQRQPREPRANQVAPAAGGRRSAGSLRSDDIPAEMYVRQREVWLRLRLHREDTAGALLHRLLVCRCCMWPN
ncbi:Coiled-coil domain-containing protein 142 [Amphibalanus amphitrite]|uniref:Coiled-coil domain-containing protein 142 n=1 Tax=Amphibalanus amphitrite TaxID=1232801 RepID=A0A6A4WAE5_AMPAM|nr:Coiled-coil domain-containing protein 142 [Amphibalanus amphitrite]